MKFLLPLIALILRSSSINASQQQQIDHPYAIMTDGNPGVMVPLPMSTWKPFEFDANGSESVFTFDNSSDSEQQDDQNGSGAPQDLLLTITDAFCAGDSFVLYDNGMFLSATPAVPADAQNCSVSTAAETSASSSSQSVAVEGYTMDPWVAMNSRNPKFSNLRLRIPGGQHTISIRTRQVLPQQGSGVGFIRVDQLSSHCIQHSYSMLTEALEWKDASDACHKNGMIFPGPLDHQYMQNEAARSVFQCGGAWTAAWLGASSGANGGCYIFRIFDSASDGVVEVVPDCSGVYPVLCATGL